MKIEKEIIGYWGYPRTFYTYVGGRKVIGVEVNDSRNKDVIIKGICIGKCDASSEDSYSDTRIWLAPQKSESIEIAQDPPMWAWAELRSFAWSEGNRRYIPKEILPQLSQETRENIILPPWNNTKE